MTSWIYGLENSSHDFTTEEAFGKNIFTNAFPLAIAQYLSQEESLPIVQIEADMAEKKDQKGEVVTDDQSQPILEPITFHKKVQWSEIIGCDPAEAYFSFEKIFDGYKEHTTGTPNQSDVVVCENTTSQKHLRPLEIKLVVVPTSGTAKNPRAKQSCEIVVRPSTVEQLAFSIADSYGEEGKELMRNVILEHIPSPMDIDWTREESMKKHIDSIYATVRGIIANGLDKQTPLVLTAVWRTEGQKAVFDEHAFDAFVWTDLAFLQLFTDSQALSRNRISRPGRTLCWLVRSLLDWSMQGTLQFKRHHSMITFGSQTDKAGAFSGQKTLIHMRSDEFTNPRLSRDKVADLLSTEALNVLQPERRLDGALAIERYKLQAVEEYKKSLSTPEAEGTAQ